jgi:hypothetical protein
MALTFGTNRFGFPDPERVISRSLRAGQSPARYRRERHDDAAGVAPRAAGSDRAGGREVI